MNDPSLWSSALSWIGTLALAVALAAATGLRAWLPLLVAGVLSKLGVAELGPSFAWLGSWPALALLGGATALEVAGDKVPVVDHALDAVGTVIRPLTATLAAAAALVHVQNPLLALVLGLVVGAPIALAPHAAKASLRGASTSTTGGLANPLLSVIEDVLSLGITLLAFLVPILVTLGLAIAAWMIWRRLRRRRVAQRHAATPGVGPSE